MVKRSPMLINKGARIAAEVDMEGALTARLVSFTGLLLVEIICETR